MKLSRSLAVVTMALVLLLSGCQSVRVNYDTQSAVVAGNTQNNLNPADRERRTRSEVQRAQAVLARAYLERAGE